MSIRFLAAVRSGRYTVRAKWSGHPHWRKRNGIVFFDLPEALATGSRGVRSARCPPRSLAAGSDLSGDGSWPRPAYPRRRLADVAGQLRNLSAHHCRLVAGQIPSCRVCVRTRKSRVPRRRSHGGRADIFRRTGFDLLAVRPSTAIARAGIRGTYLVRAGARLRHSADGQRL